MNSGFSFKEHKLSLLFALLSSLVVIFQSSRFWYFYDYSFVIENAYRFLNGSIFYKDFIFPYPPGTFLVQAFIIKIFGSSFYPQIVYCCIISFLTYLITYRILFFFNNDRWLNIFLSLPVSLTGGYGIVSFPFYDQDATFFALISIFLILYSYNKSFPLLITFLCGIVVVLPALFKQNIGYPFLIFTHLLFIIVLVFGENEIKFKDYLKFFLGSLTCIAFAFIFLHLYSGIENFYYSTIVIPRNSRLDFNYLTGSYISFISIRGVILWLAAFILIVYLYKSSLIKLTTIILLLTPVYLIPLIRMILFHKNYFDQFLSIWSITVVLAFIAFLYALFRLPGRSIFTRLFMLIPVIYVNSSFLSQSYTGSSYGIWPMLTILMAGIYNVLNNNRLTGQLKDFRKLFIIHSIALGISVLFMLIVNDEFRTIYKFNIGEEIHHSVYSSLGGISNAGEQVPNLDNLLNYTKDNIPPEDPILVIPAEEPFFFASGRKPTFPLYMFDWTFFSYKPEEILAKVGSYGIKWMILKTKLQSEWIMNWKNLEYIITMLKKEFTLSKSLPGYEIYYKNN